MADLNNKQTRRKNGQRFLPSVYTFNTVGEWAKTCLKLLLPHKGRIGFMGKLLNAESEGLVFGLLESLTTKVGAE